MQTLFIITTVIINSKLLCTDFLGGNSDINDINRILGHDNVLGRHLEYLLNGTGVFFFAANQNLLFSLIVLDANQDIFVNRPGPVI